MAIRIQPLPDETIRAMLRKIVTYHKRVNNGRRAFENKTGIHALDFDKATGGRIAGAIVKERGIGIFSETQLSKRNETCSSAGKIGGRVSGKRLAEQKTGMFEPTIQKEASSLGGKKQGRANVQNGTLDLARHKWHHVINGKKPKKRCLFCELGEERALQKYKQGTT